MAKVAPEQLAEKFRKLNATQNSIESVASYCMFYRKDACNVVNIWNREFTTAPKDKKLALLYLANHVLQEGRKRGNEFQVEFQKHLPEAVRMLAYEADDKLRRSLVKVIAVWEERRVFGPSVVRSFKELLNTRGPPPPHTSSHSGRLNGSHEDEVKLPKALKPLAELLHDLDMRQEETSRKAALTLEPLTQGVLESGDLTKLLDLEVKLKDYSLALEKENQSRRSVENLLRQMISSQEDAIKRNLENLRLVNKQQEGLNTGKQALQEVAQQPLNLKTVHFAPSPMYGLSGAFPAPVAPMAPPSMMQYAVPSMSIPMFPSVPQPESQGLPNIWAPSAAPPFAIPPLTVSSLSTIPELPASIPATTPPALPTSVAAAPMSLPPPPIAVLQDDSSTQMEEDTQVQVDPQGLFGSTQEDTQEEEDIGTPTDSPPAPTVDSPVAPMMDASPSRESKSPTPPVAEMVEVLASEEVRPEMPAVGLPAAELPAAEPPAAEPLAAESPAAEAPALQGMLEFNEEELKKLAESLANDEQQLAILAQAIHSVPEHTSLLYNDISQILNVVSGPLPTMNIAPPVVVCDNGAGNTGDEGEEYDPEFPD